MDTIHNQPDMLLDLKILMGFGTSDSLTFGVGDEEIMDRWQDATSQPFPLSPTVTLSALDGLLDRPGNAIPAQYLLTIHTVHGSA